MEDHQLFAAFMDPQTRDKAFSTIIDRYQNRVYWHLRKMLNSDEDARDVSQEVFIKVWNKLHTFKGGSKLYTWIYRVATNEALAFIDKRKRQPHRVGADPVLALQNETAPSAMPSGEDIRARLDQAIAALPAKQKQVFIMRYFDEMSYQEISDVLETSVGALKASYFHAAKKIEEMIKTG